MMVLMQTQLAWAGVQDARSQAVTKAGLAALHGEEGVSQLCCPTHEGCTHSSGVQCCSLEVSIDLTPSSKENKPIHGSFTLSIID